MDVIKKRICIEGARTRTQGMMPYYEFGKSYDVPVFGCSDVESLGLEIASGHNGNWGQFVANPCFLSDEGKTYENMLHTYYSLLNAVRSGVKLRKVDTKEGDVIFTEDLGAVDWGGDCLNVGGEPDFLYEYAVYDANDFSSNENNSIRNETKKIYRYSGDEIPEETFIAIVSDYDKFINLSSYLSGTSYEDALSGFSPENIYSGNTHYEWARYCKVVDLCIGKIAIPASIYNEHIKAPKSMPCSDVAEYVEWLMDNQKLSGDCCNARLWNDMGGNDMLEFLIGISGVCEDAHEIIDNLEYSIPYVEVPILLTQSYTDVGVFTNVDVTFYDEELLGPSSDSDSADTRPHGILQLSSGGSSGFTVIDEIDLIIHSGAGVSIDQILMCSGETRRTYPTTEEYNVNPSAYTDESGFTNYPVEVESLLQTLRTRKKYTDDRDNVLPGLFEYFEDDMSGKMFRCIRQGEENFYDLTIEQGEYEKSGVTYHTLEYEWLLNNSHTKEDIDPNNFYQGFPPVPYDKYEIGENVSNWQEKYDERLVRMQDYATPSAHTPISVSINEWRMEEIPYDVTNFTNGDGEQSEYLHYPESEINNVNKTKKYRTITTCAAGIRIAETEEEETGEDMPFMEHYYFKVKYDNSEEKPMKYPYSNGNVTNVYVMDSGTGLCDGLETYRGDFILSADTIDISGKTYFEAKYVIGGYYCGDENGKFVSYVEGTGDVYYEKHPFYDDYVDYVALDGVDNVPIWSEFIDFDGDCKEFYSTRYNLYRTGNTANIIEATTGEEWSKRDGDGLSYAYDAYLTKEDYLTNFSLPPKVDVNVTVDRGGTSAFERHYKLSECNTMQDLVNYGNHYFFPNDI